MCTHPMVASWKDLILNFLKDGTLPEDRLAAKRIQYHARRYLLQDDVLYKRGFNKPLLKCLTAEEKDYVLKEIHDRVCRNHSGGQNLAERALRQGYY